MTTDPPFHAEHIGSLLRPPSLLEARAKFEAGEISPEQVDAAESSAIREVVELQERLGFEAVTDGEFRRKVYSDNFTVDGLQGVRSEFVGIGDLAYQDAKGNRVPSRVMSVTERLQWIRPSTTPDFLFLKNLTDRVPKVTMPGPCYIHFRAGRANISEEAYPSLDLFWSDLIKCYALEMQALYNNGCRYIQLDETSLAKLGDPKIQKALAERGDDWEELRDKYADVINAVVASAPEGMTLAMHLCRGNNQGHWQAEGGYDPIAATLFRTLSIKNYFLEYDSPRAGTFEPLKELPDNKRVVLGLISTKVGALEDADEIKRRIEEAARYVDLERLGLSPQCGFASAQEGNDLTFEQQVDKLKLVKRVADEVWG